MQILKLKQPKIYQRYSPMFQRRKSNAVLDFHRASISSLPSISKHSKQHQPTQLKAVQTLMSSTKNKVYQNKIKPSKVKKFHLLRQVNNLQDPEDLLESINDNFIAISSISKINFPLVEPRKKKAIVRQQMFDSQKYKIGLKRIARQLLDRKPQQYIKRWEQRMSLSPEFQSLVILKSESHSHKIH